MSEHPLPSAAKKERDCSGEHLIPRHACHGSVDRNLQSFWTTIMNSRVFISLVLLADLSGEAFAACSGTQVTDSAGTKETAVITFAGGNPVSVTVAGLTWAPSGNKTATGVAAAFANLANGATTGGGSPANAYSGALSGWSSGAASGSQVTFTRTIVGNVPNISAAGTPTAPAVTTTDGTAAVTLSDLLSGNTVCVGSSGNWLAQEYHSGAAAGPLIDWKRGAGHPVDPTKQVGSWSISGTGAATVVNYTYGSTTYSNAVWNHGDGTYSFCNNQGVETVGRIKTGQGACP